MFFLIKLRRRFVVGGVICLLILTLAAVISLSRTADTMYSVNAEGKKHIKWVDFTVPSSLMRQAMEMDISSRGEESAVALDWIEMLSYLGAKYGGDFDRYKKDDLQKLAETLRDGKSMAEMTEKMQYYAYYHEAYTAVLGGLVGQYEIQNDSGDWEQRYGLKAFLPIAKGYDYSHYDDFGAGRDYGYSRKHLGHDMMALTGTPVIAIESGVIEVMGWNQYGGWRVGVRSFDGRRYYYYAHLRQNRPFADGLQEGQVVMAGDVIGYVGRTGYSTTENTNGIKQSHLHYGLQLIFDESQKEGVNQIWIDLYDFTQLLSTRRSSTVRDDETKEHFRAVKTREVVPENRFVPSGPPPEEEIIPDAENAVQDVDSDQSEAVMKVELPILMYHDLFKDAARQATYTVTPMQFESDLKYLKEHGYHTVTAREAADFVLDGASMPDNPVMITFDDGHYNNLHYAEPLLEKYGMRAVLFVVGEYCERGTREGEENPNYSYITWERLSKISDGSVWDIQSHSWGMHGDGNGGTRFGVGRKAGESDEGYFAALSEDISKITDKLTQITGYRPTAFAYPYGKTDPAAEHALREAGYTMTVCSTTGKAVLEEGRPETLYMMKRLPRTNVKSVAELLN